jgi:ribosomal protein S18 acetylase RimI-like enzyme
LGMSRAVNVEIRELTPELLDDYLQFFDKDAFADFPNWSGCYCGFYDTPGEGKDWNPTAKAGPAHRAARAERISSGKSHGILAYADGKVVGWCNAQGRASFQNMRRYSVAIENPDEAVGSIMCFLVAPAYRGKGVCRSLLDAACDMFRREKLEVAEGYPTATNPVRGSMDIPWAEENYKGPLSMYLKAGFKIHRQLERFAIVRKQL